MAESDTQAATPEPATPLVLLTGATGYVGNRLLPQLEQRDLRVRCLARKPDKLRSAVAESTELVKGDVLERSSLDRALSGVTTAYYLVHLMASSANFEKQDREAAENFGAAAKEAGVKRLIYLGGLGEEADPYPFTDFELILVEFGSMGYLIRHHVGEQTKERMSSVCRAGGEGGRDASADRRT